ncbi:nucleotidyltransferase family protein [Leptospira ilyithenensis]|uniref:Nucleotidyltransferase family protein n=1 Tax=Leptospira ilyithenensis TaxID=2484901 RepID=A0A4R9LKD4_9LEPT|nr:nucleotidyltransferase family protein [Leptospira ilyithenensis]TGN07992.1 nucleotidyltransferase family protein [Leptospira ilyithenensis]
MKALLLAAGLGTRLRPITNDIPKCLVPINSRPLLDYWLELLTDANVKDILVNLHYFPEQVVRYIEGSKYKDIATTIFEPELLGTGGTLLKNRSFFENDQVMLIHADNLSKFNILNFIDSHYNRPSGTEMTMMTFVTDIPETCGIVELDAENRLVQFHEKVKNPPGNVANGAVYILEPSVIDFLSSLNQDFIDFSTEVIPKYLGRINTFLNSTYHRDIGNLESYAKAQDEFSKLFSI